MYEQVIDVGAPFFITVYVTVVLAGGFDATARNPRTMPLVVIVSQGAGGSVGTPLVLLANTLHAPESGPYRVVPLGPKLSVDVPPA